MVAVQNLKGDMKRRGMYLVSATPIKLIIEFL
jgi:hypothetical protein